MPMEAVGEYLKMKQFLVLSQGSGVFGSVLVGNQFG